MRKKIARFRAGIKKIAIFFVVLRNEFRLLHSTLTNGIEVSANSHFNFSRANRRWIFELFLWHSEMISDCCTVNSALKKALCEVSSGS